MLGCLLLSTVPVPVFAETEGPDNNIIQADGSTVPVESKAFVFSQTIYPDTGAIIAYENIILDIPAGAVSELGEITIEKLDKTASLPGTFTNATAGAAGYRFGPHGMVFNKDIKVCLPFAPEIAESEAALSNLFTYFFNETAGKWERLEKITVDRDNCRIISITNHFTDMVNTTLKLPELPKGVDFNLNSIKELKAADPMTEIPGLQGPRPDNTGSASFTIPFRLPGGRGMATPELGLQYSSEAPSGWVGRGFDITLPRISIDTRFGLPDYTKEDTYLLNGEKLLLYQEAAGYDVYRPARERSFRDIRHIYDGFDSNYWIVTGKDGSIQYFGQNRGWLGPKRTDKSRVFTWYLTRSEDNNGNLVDYAYEYDVDNAYTNLKQIRYSGFTDGINSESGPYTVTFESEDRPDRRIDNRGRFVSKCARRLAGIVVAYNGTAVRRYSFNYTENIYGQSILASYSEEDGEGNVFYTYGFDYYELPEHRDLAGNLLGYNGFSGEKQWGGGGSADLKGLDEKISCSMGGSLYAGMKFYIPKFFARKVGASFGVRGGVNFGMDFSKSMLMDVNGDGLPDMTWKEGSTLYSYLNTINESGEENYFDIYSPYAITGVSELLNKGTQAGFSLGLSAQLMPISVGISKQYNWSESESTFADVNGDGLVDIVDAGSSSWKRNTGKNRFVNEIWNFGEDNSSNTGDINPAVQDEFNRIYYPQEPLRRWKAYVPGRVIVENEIALPDGYGVSSDGLDADTYAGGTKHSIHLDRDTISASNFFREQMDYGEAVYFHLATGNDHRGDSLKWNTTIKYESIALFDGLKDSAILSPPVRTAEAKLPGNDDRFFAIYSLAIGADSSYYELRADWKEHCSKDVYDAIAACGFFIPRKIPLELFLKLFNAASNSITPGIDYSARANILRAYTFVPEQQTFYLKSSLANNVILSLAPLVWSAEEKQQLMFSSWIDGERIYPSADGASSSFTQVRNSTPGRKIYPAGCIAALGEYVLGKGFLLDRIYDPGDKSRPLYSLWLTQKTNGSREVIREETTGDIPEPDAVSVTEDIVRISQGGITSEYRFTDMNYIIEEIPADFYNEVVDAAFMDESVFA
ncbi:MAG: hypothetical protein OQK82_02485, partial [Candidatus Pacearchaeota archaeon]|nr:hypothetical protein [Candidatus Pacearchaeota archaeon]